MTEKKPNQADIGRALGLSRSAITLLKNQGMPVDSIEAAQAWRERSQNIAARKPAPAALVPPAAASDDYDAPDDVAEGHDAARTRLRISEANLSEMREAEMRRELIRVDAVKAALSTAFASAREGLLQIPPRIAPILAAEVDAGQVQVLLETEIHHALKSIAGASERLDRGGDD